MGCDPSLNGFAVSLPNGQCFTIGSSMSAGAWQKLGWTRLSQIRASLDHYIRSSRPGLFVVESLLTTGQGNVGPLAMAHGVAREVAAANKVPIAEVNPTTLKLYATGKGNADKALMVVEANRAREPWVLNAVVGDDNQADADWLRRMGEHWAFGKTVSPDHAARRAQIFGPWKKAPGAKWPALPK